MALSDTKIRSLSAKARAYQVADSGGLVIEVLPTGRKVWRLRYRFNGKPQKATLGEYPAFTLAEARLWREECRAMIAHGVSPAQKKQQDKTKQKEPIQWMPSRNVRDFVIRDFRRTTSDNCRLRIEQRQMLFAIYAKCILLVYNRLFSQLSNCNYGPRNSTFSFLPSN